MNGDIQPVIKLHLRDTLKPYLSLGLYMLNITKSFVFLLLLRLLLAERLRYQKLLLYRA